LREWTEKGSRSRDLATASTAVGGGTVASPAERSSPARGSGPATRKPVEPAVRLLVLNLALALVYYLGGTFGLRLASPHPSVTLVWPPSGIALACLLLLGPRLWPGVFVGALAVNISVSGHFGSSLGIALGNTLEVLISAALVQRYAHGRYFSTRAGDVFRFILYGALGDRS